MVAVLIRLSDLAKSTIRSRAIPDYLSLELRDLILEVVEHPLNVGGRLVGDLLQGPENYRTR